MLGARLKSPGFAERAPVNLQREVNDALLDKVEQLTQVQKSLNELTAQQ